MNQKRFEEIKKKAAFAPVGGVVKLTVEELVQIANASKNPVLLFAAQGLDDPGYAGNEIYPQAAEVAAACDVIEKALQQEPPAATEPTATSDSPPAATEPTATSDSPPAATEPTATSDSPPAATEPTASSEVSGPLFQE